MKNLLIDIGNSAIKSAIAEQGYMQIARVERKEYNKKSLLKEFDDHVRKYIDDKDIVQAGISVLDKVLVFPLERIMKRHFGFSPTFIGPESKLPFDLLYEKTIGSDRLCSSTSAYFKTKSDTILTIDFGTATTYTVIHKKELIGGMISPGIGTSYNALISKTALPESKLRFPKSPVSRKTLENIAGGVLFQSLYTTERYIEEISETYGETFVICTGGFSSMIMNKTDKIDKRDNTLVLEGINLIISQ